MKDVVDTRPAYLRAAEQMFEQEYRLEIRGNEQTAYWRHMCRSECSQDWRRVPAIVETFGEVYPDRIKHIDPRPNPMNKVIKRVTLTEAWYTQNQLSTLTGLNKDRFIEARESLTMKRTGESKTSAVLYRVDDMLLSFLDQHGVEATIAEPKEFESISMKEAAALHPFINEKQIANAIDHKLIDCQLVDGRRHVILNERWLAWVERCRKKNEKPATRLKVRVVEAPKQAEHEHVKSEPAEATSSGDGQASTAAGLIEEAPVIAEDPAPAHLERSRHLDMIDAIEDKIARAEAFAELLAGRIMMTEVAEAADVYLATLIRDDLHDAMEMIRPS